MRINLLKPSKLVIGSLILLLVSVLSMNAYSYLSTQGEIARKLAEAEKYKKESLTLQSYIFSDKSSTEEPCAYYSLILKERGESWNCNTMEELAKIIADYPPTDLEGNPYTWIVYFVEGSKRICDFPGFGCTPTICSGL